MDAERLLAWRFPPITHRYSCDDTMLYALAIGAAADPTDENELRFVDDTGAEPTLALPTMSVVIGFPGSWMADPATGIDFAKIVHGEEEIAIHRPLAAAGTLTARHRVVDVIDKGAGRGALITYDKDLFDEADGAHVATVRHTTFARGNGGFSTGAPPRAKAPRLPDLPDRAPDRTRTLEGQSRQALLYRLCGDRNPLHSNPCVARAAGFERPILHGLCSFGMAGLAMVSDWCGYDPARLTGLRMRFAAPIYPGEALTVDSWQVEDGVRFQAHATSRGAVVLSHGFARIRADA